MAEDRDTREPARRPGGRTARVRRRILEAATELIARDGIGGLRYDQVARLAEVNKTTVYRNWPDRNALVADALATFGADAAPMPGPGEVADRFRETVTTATGQPARSAAGSPRRSQVRRPALELHQGVTGSGSVPGSSR